MKMLDQIDDRNDKRTDLEKLTDGRQTRPANDVGRPNGGTERPFVDGRRKAWERWISSPAAAQIDFDHPTATAWAAAFEAGWHAGRAEETRQRQRRRKAPYGETPQDAEA